MTCVKIFRNSYQIILGTILIITTFVSCKKTFDILPEDKLDHQQVYQNVYDADAAVIAIYGKLLSLADRIVILNELQGDLMDVTPNADRYLQEINLHNVSVNNPYANPRPFYELIVDCNDVLNNLNIMLASKRINQTDYDIRYSTVGGIRSWLYLELGILFGNIPYVTSPMDNIDEVNNPNNYPRLSFDQLLDSLIQFTESLPYKDLMPSNISLMTSINGYSTSKFFIPIRCLLGDLYLWKGEYTQAATHYHIVMNYADILYPDMNSEQWYETYKVAWTANLYGANWVNIFSQPYGERYSNYEIIWDLPFDQNFLPTNPFIKLFDNSVGDYLLKPSTLAIQNWNNQTRNDHTPGDYRGVNASWKWSAGAPIVNKFTAYFDPLQPFVTNGKWILYRAALLHLRYAEAANRDHHQKLAYALLNVGIGTEYDPVYDTTGVGGGQSRDVTNIQQSFGPPYDFDARFGNYPFYRGPWHRNIGIRGRVSLPPDYIDSTKYYDMSSPDIDKPIIDEQGLTLTLENDLIDEDALEMAFEGNRWPDLLRIALRREKEQAGSGVAFLQSHIAAKFTSAGDAADAAMVSARLADPKNWYLPFKWQ